jgi:hypothetical protein
MAENNFRKLNYTHEEIEYVLGKIFNNEYNFLTYEQYDRLINQIGLDKICNKDDVSDLKIKYDNIIDAPNIPDRISSLINDRDFITTDAVNRKLNAVAENLRRELNDIENNGFIRYAKSVDLANLKASMELSIQSKIESNNLLYGIANKVNRSDLNNYAKVSHTHSEFINYNKDIKDLKDKIQLYSFEQEKVAIYAELITTQNEVLAEEIGAIKSEHALFEDRMKKIETLEENISTLLAFLNNNSDINDISMLRQDVADLKSTIDDLKSAINSKMDKALAELNFNEMDTRISALEDKVNNLNNNSNTNTGEVDADTLNRISTLEAKLLELESMTLFIDEEE